MFENLSIGHLAVVLVIVLLLFGAKRIPEIAGSLGNGIKEFKKSISDPSAATPTESVREARDARVPSTPPNSVPFASGMASQIESDTEREPKRLMR